jgi:apolipoprotein N-acyltransferase
MTNTNLGDSVIAVIRTFVPALVGTLIAWLTTNGVALPEDASAALTTFLVALFTALYYAVVTFLERKVNPNFGWLLGLPKAPTYVRGEVVE